MKLCRRIKKIKNKDSNKVYQQVQAYINVPNMLLNSLDWQMGEELVAVTNPTNKMLMLIPISHYNCDDVNEYMELLDDAFKVKTKEPKVLKNQISTEDYLSEKKEN